MSEQYSTVQYAMSFFVLSSIDGLLGCLHVLAIGLNAAVNMGARISHQNPAFGFLSIYPEVELRIVWKIYF